MIQKIVIALKHFNKQSEDVQVSIQTLEKIDKLCYKYGTGYLKKSVTNVVIYFVFFFR